MAMPGTAAIGIGVAAADGSAGGIAAAASAAGGDSSDRLDDLIRDGRWRWGLPIRWPQWRPFMGLPIRWPQWRPFMPPQDDAQRVDYRSKARSHVLAARELLTSDDAFAPTYACLQARFAIEALAYDRLQDYLFEVSAEAMNGWTPKAVLKELLYTDPEACSPITLTIGWRPDPHLPPQEIDLGESYRFSAQWANRMHHALSSFLHQPTLRQFDGAEIDNRQQAKQKAEEALLELEHVLSSSVWSFRAHRLVKTRCICGSLIARDLEFIEAGKVVSCSTCERLYNCLFDEAKGGFEFWPQQASWTCPQCKTFHSTDAVELKSPKMVECSGCAEKFEIAQKIVLTRVATAGVES
jgi:hypothetical protein